MLSTEAFVLRSVGHVESLHTLTADVGVCGAVLHQFRVPHGTGCGAGLARGGLVPIQAVMATRTRHTLCRLVGLLAICLLQQTRGPWDTPLT